ncbi:MAG: hypothetical protein RLY93_03365 [Sumerlaeia bacterium]
MKRMARDPLMSWKGYLLANAAVWVLTIAVYAMVSRGMLSSVGPHIDRLGSRGMLLFIPAAFLFASVFDYLFDRLAVRKKSDPDKPSAAHDG